MQCDGSKKLLKIGDQIPVDEVDKLHYDRTGECEDDGNCKDSFTYRSIVKWAGEGT